ncbi:Fur family transcriptional regulator [Primorskyibacter flagellatus]|uniref:Fur family transcriptional regulator n=1 Tax=Primorskyibacter flagellatus TaxID=1387277 RepID=A0A917EG83_9RHOB|nr:Fur family transcriptional regulator [Primorskyibacter flagellatus]GGE36267.1 Fur family transcriptional regulator [Primorskyibacter flagellatus]
MSKADPEATPREFLPHDHAHCVSDAMAAAESLCAESGARLTPVRRRVLEILLEGHRPMGAYDVLSRLDAEGLGSKPPVAYRALGFLVDQGLAHRIERLNAFIACPHPSGQDHVAAFLICRDCGTVAEVPSAPPPLPAGFQVEQTTIEAVGLCTACADGPAT